ncbi:acyl-CoA synthetase [Nocardiopsis alba]|uniref:AMP-binding enzyme family protein n=1 Tax=Nocardiopsis alba (strain ATCC BAA-2165 / BE74) TaxID=1205910 RepID=J7LGZ3_NOCAA|nr:acyl-CoA synthetase [Nocardiopsis alba]AFR10164.1 AMP-binding enzyme family protein [Nocardiopsis alba ATCC BAA-2165]
MSPITSSTVDGVLHRSATRTPERTALIFEGRSWTYAELDDAVTRAAARLLSLGATKGDRIAAYGRNSDAYLIGYLACARAGLVHVPVNFALQGEELAYLLEQSGSTMVLVDPALRSAVDALRSRTGVEQVLELREGPGSLLAQALEGPVPELDVEVADTDLVQLLYTSGTTSRPKGAMMTHRALVHEYLSCLAALDLKADDHPLHAMPLYHSAQMHVFLMPWLAVGATNTLVETPDPADVLRRIEADRHGAFFAAPTLWVAMAGRPEFDDRDLTSLRKAYYGASIMPGPVLERLRTALPELGFYNCFGQSEIGPLATVLRPEEHADRPSSAGRSVLFVEMRVVDDQGREVAPGESGEVVYRSPQLCEGYWDKPEETAEAFRDGWFHSGDLVRADAEGYIEVVDRIKDAINTGGVLVASREIEDVLFAHPDVAEAAVVGMPDAKWIEAVTAFVIPTAEADADTLPDRLVAHVKERLAPFKVPKEVRLVTELPRNASGKILKRELRERDA